MLEYEWLELAWINFEKVILYGQVIDKNGLESSIEQILTQSQKDAVYDLNIAQQEEMFKLLRSFVNYGILD